jgi:hypothetical protein
MLEKLYSHCHITGAYNELANLRKTVIVVITVVRIIHDRSEFPRRQLSQSVLYSRQTISAFR